ncbi:MAG: glycosyltransferase [Pseudomonadota bacterium]
MSRVAVQFSVIIPTYQRRDLVIASMTDLAQQQYSDGFEVIVVVDGSTDGSAEALQQLETPFPLRVLTQQNQGRANALNNGAKTAQGKTLLFLDDDMAAHPALLAQHARSHQAGTHLVLGHIPVHPEYLNDFLGTAVQQWAHERLERLSKRDATLTLQDLITGQASVSRTVFDELGGFDEGFNRNGAFGNEDLDFCLRLQKQGYQIVFNQNAISWQKYTVTPRHHLRQWHEAGGADVVFARKHPEQCDTIFATHSQPYAMARLLTHPLRSLVLWLLELGWQNRLLVKLFFFVRELEYARGAARAVGGIPGRWPLRILAYHAISDLAGEPILAQYGVPADLFQAQLDALKKAGYHFVYPDEFLRFLKGQAGLPRNSLLLTFDDCYQDLLDAALPILAERKIPALAFAVSGKLGSSNDWDKEIGAPQLPLLDAAGLKNLAEAGVEIGAHSRNHVPLTWVNCAQQLAEEIAGAVDELEANGLPRPRFFAYPHGEYDQRSQLAVQAAGLEAAFTVEASPVTPYHHCYRIPRIEIMRSDARLRFRWKVATAGRSLYDWTSVSKAPSGKRRVSVVVPAYNVEATVEKTLASLQSQTFPHWEAVIVDDGSTDSTALIARDWASRDSRICVVSQANGGEGAARNTGIGATRHEWLLFLDADDWIAPDCLELMLGKLASEPHLAGVVCGCVRVTPTGLLCPPAIYEPWSLDNLFPQFARDCPFAIHNCMVRRSLAIEIGGFDTSLVTCADWDFWQRVARTGSRLGTVAEVLAFYRMRPGSSSSNAERVLQDGITVIRRGYSHDPRVLHPHPDYRDGLSSHDLPEALFRHALWPASLLFSQGRDALDLLAVMDDEQAPGLCPETVAKGLFDCIPLAAADTIAAWPALWPELNERLKDYLVAVEAKSGVLNLAARAERRLEQLILESMEFTEAAVLGVSCGINIDISKPIRDVTVPSGVEQAVIVVNVSGDFIGSIPMPIGNDTIPSGIIAEAVVADLAWPLIKRHFRLNLPEGSPLKSQLYYLMHETQPLRVIGQLISVAYPLLHWQFRAGVIKRPRLLIDLLSLFIKLKPVSLTWEMMNMSKDNRRSHLKETILHASERMAREEFIALDPSRVHR